jgi:hypothetical protein
MTFTKRAKQVANVLYSLLVCAIGVGALLISTTVLSRIFASLVLALGVISLVKFGMDARRRSTPED